MSYIIDTNVIYYALKLENNNGFNYSLEKLPVGSWHITDLNILESYNRYGKKRDSIIILADFYKKRLDTIVNILNNDTVVSSILNANFGSEVYKEKLTQLCELKKELELQAVKFCIDLLVICNAQKQILSDKIDMKESSIWKAISAQIFANDVFLKKLIREHLETFYRDEKESKLKSEIQKIMLMALYVSEWVLLSVKQGVSLSMLHNGFVNNSISTRKDPCMQAIKKITGMLNKEKKRHHKWVEIDESLVSSLNLFEAAANHYPEISMGFMKYMKELTLRVLSVGKKIHKNDMIDALFFKNYPKHGILTEDVSFRSMIKSIDSALYEKGKKGMLIIKRIS